MMMCAHEDDGRFMRFLLLGYEITSSPFVLLSGYAELQQMTRKPHTERRARARCR